MGKMLARVDRPFGAMRVSVGEWPLLIAEFPEKRNADEDVFAAFDYIEALMKDAALRREKVFVIADRLAGSGRQTSSPAARRVSRQNEVTPSYRQPSAATRARA
jgi:hypothetical protein